MAAPVPQTTSVAAPARGGINYERLYAYRFRHGYIGGGEVFAPAGLDLGAETPEELALALVSEIQAVFSEATAESLRDRKAPIHGWNIASRRVRAEVKECATSAP